MYLVHKLVHLKREQRKTASWHVDVMLLWCCVSNPSISGTFQIDCCGMLCHILREGHLRDKWRQLCFYLRCTGCILAFQEIYSPDRPVLSVYQQLKIHHISIFTRQTAISSSDDYTLSAHIRFVNTVIVNTPEEWYQFTVKHFALPINQNTFMLNTLWWQKSQHVCLCVCQGRCWFSQCSIGCDKQLLCLIYAHLTIPSTSCQTNLIHLVSAFHDTEGKGSLMSAVPKRKIPDG